MSVPGTYAAQGVCVQTDLSMDAHLGAYCDISSEGTLNYVRQSSRSSRRHVCHCSDVAKVGF